MTSTWFGNPAPATQKFADERDHLANFINCVAASGVTLANAATLGDYPTADTEVQALRKATGDTQGGESLQALRVGLKARYGLTGALSATSWSPILTGLGKNVWFAVVGHELALPERLRTQRTDVFHCVVLAPDTKPGATNYRLIDPMDTSDKGHPSARHISRAEAKAFCSSGAYAALGIAEGHAASNHWEVTVKRSLHRTYRLYTTAHGLWQHTDDRTFKGYTARCSAPMLIQNVEGKTRTLVQCLEGPDRVRGKYLNVKQSSRIVAVEKAGR